jgi:S-adenosylhomocysteine hydrolase
MPRKERCLASQSNYDVRDIALAREGKLPIEWANAQTPHLGVEIGELTSELRTFLESWEKGI